MVCEIEVSCTVDSIVYDVYRTIWFAALGRRWQMRLRYSNKESWGKPLKGMYIMCSTCLAILPRCCSPWGTHLHSESFLYFFLFLPVSLSLFLRKGLSTYKELCSLASDLNKPDLIYKFMHLANHNALWNSKKVGTEAMYFVYMVFVSVFTHAFVGVWVSLLIHISLDVSIFC